MLQLSGTMLNRDVLSLRTGSPIAQITASIINPDNLKIEGFYCTEFDTKQQMVLLYQDIRDILPQGVVVNDLDALSEPEELIRLKKILEMDFELLGKPVVTISNEKIGKVSDYAFETATLYIQKVYASQSLLKSLTVGSLSIDRNQIQEITPKKVIIQDLLQGTPAGAAATA
ncbi:MAG TPA: PRC-barrel domain-containing protein [Candidatus Saccharimonadales bacterium]